MGIQYTTIQENSFARGIDARSSENQIQAGYVRDLLNGNIIETRAGKRPGYQGYAGNVPVRVTRLEYEDATNEVCFTLDSAVSLDTAVSLETVRSSPIVVYGRSSIFTAGDGPFTDTDSAHYYEAFFVPTRKQFFAPSGTLNVPGDEHGFGTTNIFTNVVESTSTIDRSYQSVLSDAIRVDETSFDINIDYTTYIDRNVYVYYKDQTPVTGSSYVATLVHGGAGSQTFSIPAGTHALSNFDIIPQIQQDTGTERLQVVPDSFLVASNGDVSITIVSSSAATYYAILSAAPVANSVSGIVNSGATSTVTISNPDKPWIFYGIYLEQTPGGTKELVYPDSIEFDEPSNTVTLTFTNATATAKNFIVFYEYGDIRSNKLCVTDLSVTTSGTDDVPQLTIWGLSHEEIYVSKSAREGWVNHIDSYRSSAEQRVICGLGGNLFSAREYDESATTYLYPRLFSDLSSRSLADSVLGPVFWDTGETPGRTRGYITTDDSGEHWVSISAVRFDVGTGWTVYTLETPNIQVLDSTGNPASLTDVISEGLDWVTVTDMSYARHEGTFRVMQVTDDPGVVYLWVENSDNSVDYDDAGVGGFAGVFTDQITWMDDSPYISGDMLISEVLGDTFVCSVLSSDSDTSVIDGITDLIQVPGGLTFNASRTSSVIPLRSASPSASPNTTNLVRGDMLSYSGPDILNNKDSTARLFRVLHINANPDITVNITEDGTNATVTLGSGTTDFLSQGQNVIILNAGVYTGVHEISDIVSGSTFTFLLSDGEFGSVSGATLAGETAEIDERLNWKDSPADAFYFTVETRWIPIEAPDDTFDLTPFTHVRYFDTDSYSDQSFLRSTMIANNMYLNNGRDEAYKFDGTSNYRSGLLDWQPGLFISQESTGATIVTDLKSISVDYSTVDLNAGRLTITSDQVDFLAVGTNVRLAGSPQTYSIKSYTNDGTNYYIFLDRSLDAFVSTAGTHPLSEIGTYRYYYRLNAIDANDNITASAVAGHEDHVVELVSNSAVLHKIVGMPAWDVYDYDRLEVQIYRTKLNQAAPFYLVTTLPMDFDNTQGYINFRDSFADDDLSQLDIVNTALKGSELGTGWSQPLRSKYITSIGNRLVQGNIRDYPQLDIQIVGDASISNSTFAGDTLLFRRDNADTGTTTDMVNRAKYEWINGFTGDAGTYVIGVDQFSFNTSINTGASEGDWIYLTYHNAAATARIIEYSGWYQIASAVGATVTVNLVGAAVAATYPDKYAIATDPTDIPVLLGTDGNLGMVNGDSFDTFDAMRRMSMAINSTMRMVDISLTGMEDFVPWMTCRGGNDLAPAGRLIVRQPRSDELIMELVPTFSGYSLFVNNIRRSSTDQISASTRVYPSRVLVSYENYPEIMDSPGVILDSDSDSAVDVNPADGQEITGIIPFFGETAFTAAQQASILVVLKTNSIYLVDVNQKALGNQCVQRIETEGLGCTAPYSIAVSKKGIIFANESGIYCLRRDLSITYVGKYMERNWTERVSLDHLALAQGHHYGVGRAYKLSVPLADSINTDSGYIENSEVYVYDHTNEDPGQDNGAWGRYDNHPATGWANLASDAFFGVANGRVFSIRNTGLDSDYRDDSSPVDFTLTPRQNDFGNAGIRKVIDKAIIHYRVGATNTGTEVNYSVDLEEEYQPTTDFTILKSTASTGIGDPVPRSVVSIRHSVGRRRGVYFGLQITNSTIDENVEIAGIDYKVGGLSDKGILSAAGTR